jgi:hypothetical protein
VIQIYGMPIVLHVSIQLIASTTCSSVWYYVYSHFLLHTAEKSWFCTCMASPTCTHRRVCAFRMHELPHWWWIVPQPCIFLEILRMCDVRHILSKGHTTQLTLGYLIIVNNDDNLFNIHNCYTGTIGQVS